MWYTRFPTLVDGEMEIRFIVHGHLFGHLALDGSFTSQLTT